MILTIEISKKEAKFNMNKVRHPENVQSVDSGLLVESNRFWEVLLNREITKVEIMRLKSVFYRIYTVRLNTKNN